jgi:hypothetical protein
VRRHAALARGVELGARGNRARLRRGGLEAELARHRIQRTRGVQDVLAAEVPRLADGVIRLRQAPLLLVDSTACISAGVQTKNAPSVPPLSASLAA